MTPSIFLAYDVLNRLTNMIDAVGDTAYSYDSVGELLSENGPWANDTVSYSYTNRLRTGISLSQPSGSWSQSYGYDLARRLTNVVSPGGSFSYVYDAAQHERVDELTLPNGAYITNGFDSVARLLSTALDSSTNSDLDSYAYGYNQAGERTNVVRTAGDFVNYTYDDAGELTTAQGHESGGTSRLQEQLSYAYDAAGNPSYRTNNTLLENFNVNDLNELTTVTNGGPLTVAGTTTIPATSVTVNTSNAILYADSTFASTNQPWTNGLNTYTAVAQDSYGHLSTNSVTADLQGTNDYTYDANGNLTSDGTRSFAYDDENQLVGVSVAGVYSNSFAYDGKLRRRIETDYSWNGSSWTQTNETLFVYDGNVVIQERNGSDTPEVTYTRGDDLSGTLQGAGGIGGLLARTDYGQEIPGSPTTAYYHADGNGNVTMLLYNNGIIAAKYLYDPYGNTLSLSGPLANLNTYRFSSKEWDSSSGLYYYLYRFYDPNLQRWVNRDPLGEQGGINLYQFDANNPNNYFDPLGESWLSDIIQGSQGNYGLNFEIGPLDATLGLSWQKANCGDCWNVSASLELSYSLGVKNYISSLLRISGSSFVRNLADYVPHVDVGGGASGSFTFCPPDEINGNRDLDVYFFIQAAEGHGVSYNTPGGYILPGESGPPISSYGFFAQARIEGRFLLDIQTLDVSWNGIWLTGSAGYRWGRHTFGASFSYSLDSL